MRETKIEANCREWFKKRGGILQKVPSGDGFPDRIAISAKGRVAFLEFKKKGGAPQPRQDYWLRRLRLRNHIAIVIDSVEQFKQIIEDLERE